MSTAVVTVWTGPPEGCLLAESARHFGVPLLVTQRGRAWGNLSHNKVDVLFPAVRALPAEVVLFADGGDAVFTRPDAAAAATAALAESGRDFLVGAEVTCWPWPGRHGPRHPAGPGPRYPNSGCWVATRAGADREFRAMLAAKAADDGYAEWRSGRHACDQPLFHDRALAGGMAVDHDSRLVLNLSGLGWPDGHVLRRVARGDAPAVLHGSGRAKGQVRRVWGRLKRLGALARGSVAPGLGAWLAALPPLGRVAAVGAGDDDVEVLGLFAAEPVETGSEVACFPDGHFDLVYFGAGGAPDAAGCAAWVTKVRAGGSVAGRDPAALALGGHAAAEQVPPGGLWAARVPAPAPPPRLAAPRAPETLSVIVPTVGRPTLARTLASIAAQGGPESVEVVLAVDGDWPEAHRIFRESGVRGACVPVPGPHRDWGHTPTNLAAPHAGGAYLMRLDDDNVYLPGAFAAVRAALAENPGRPHAFRVARGPQRDVLWRTPEVDLGNVDAQMFVVPNAPGKVGRWGTRYEGDFDFIRDTAARYPDGAVVWRREVVAAWRPADLVVPRDVAGWLPLDQGEALFLLATGGRVLEIGSYAGRSAVCVAQAAACVLCVDPFDGRATPAPRDTLPEFKANVARYGVAGRVRPLVGTAAAVGPTLADAAFDLVFVDGDHTRPAVAADLDLARRVLAPGGRIAVHDYGDPDHPGVAAAVGASGLAVDAVVGTLAVCRVRGGHARAVL